MREQKRALNKTSRLPRRYDYLSQEDRIEWMPSIEPIIPEKLPRYTQHSPVRQGTINNTETNILNTRVSSSSLKVKAKQKIRTKEARKLSLDNSVRLSERNFLAQLVKLDFQRTQVMFDSTINIYEVDDYDRKIEKTWTRLTQLEKVLITV